MIDIFAIWKSELFISAAKEMFSQRNITISCICTNPENILEDYYKCSPRPQILLLDTNWADNKLIAEIVEHILLSTEPVRIILTTTFFKQHDLAKLGSIKVKGSFNRNQNIDEIVKCIIDVSDNKISFAEK